ncbi:MAG: hypothetical protein ACK55Z_35605 [bacterium]
MLAMLLTDLGVAFVSSVLTSGSSYPDTGLHLTSFILKLFYNGELDYVSRSVCTTDGGCRSF